jgi:CP family cyanate transporter-like MFS transporter
MTTRSKTFTRDTLIAIAGVVLISLNMRTAVSGLSPLYDIVSRDVPLGLDARALLGALPPFAFVLGGLVTPRITRRIGLEWTLVLLLALMVVGHIVRGFATSWFTIVIGSALVLIGSGMGNVSLPPTIKRYFPDSVGPMSSLYITFVSISSILPPLIAVPLSHAASWRVALGIWVLTALAAMLPWFAAIKGGHHSGAQFGAHDQSLKLRKSPTAWAVTTILSVSSVTGYGMFAWLPTISVETAGVNDAGGGVMLALFAGAGLPLALGIPALAGRLRGRVEWLVYIGVALTITGALGLALIPKSAPYLWAFVFGSGPLLFPLALVLINLRTESTATSLRLSSFTQSIAYVLAGIATPLMGFTRGVTGSWTFALLGVAVASTSAIWAARVLARNHTVEADLRS